MNPELATRVSTIVVGVDGSPESDRAATFAAQLALQTGARIIAVHAVGLLDVWQEDAGTADRHNSHAHVTALRDGPWTDTIRQTGVQPTVALVDGAPAHALLMVADEVDADLIVVGSRGAGEAELFALGNTSTKLAHQSARPVLIVPPPRSAPPADRVA